jgi:hypothetical protein
MNTIKYINYNTLKQPQAIILTKNGEKIVLERLKTVKYYDKASKCYRYFPITYKINNNYYA